MRKCYVYQIVGEGLCLVYSKAELACASVLNFACLPELKSAIALSNLILSYSVTITLFGDIFGAIGAGLRVILLFLLIFGVRCLF